MMKILFLYLFVLCAYSQLTFNNPLAYSSSAYSITSAVNGLEVAFTGATYVVSDPFVTDGSVSTYTFYTTLISSTSSIAIGLSERESQGTTCTTALYGGTSTLVGKQSFDTCHLLLDLWTFYQAPPTGFTASTITSALAVNNPYKWTISPRIEGTINGNNWACYPMAITGTHLFLS